MAIKEKKWERDFPERASLRREGGVEGPGGLLVGRLVGGHATMGRR